VQVVVGLALLHIIGNSHRPVIVVASSGLTIVASGLAFVTIGLSHAERRHLLQRVVRG
jgi:hypothetical protein